MKNMKEYLKSKSIIINSNVFKNVLKLNISLDEFLLILYFINIDTHLDLEHIKKYINITDEKILNIYTNLIQKGFIEVKINKVNNTIDEEILLDMFYDKLVLLNQEEKDNKDIFSIFENEFGRSLSPIEMEMINHWLDNNISKDIIVKALKESVLNGVSNLKYIDRILYTWTKKGNNKSDDNLFDYNWLDDEK